MSFVGPLAYFALKRRLPVPAQAPLALIAGLGALQLYVGRAMVEHNVHRRAAPDDDSATYEGATLFLPVHVRAIGDSSG